MRNPEGSPNGVRQSLSTSSTMRMYSCKPAICLAIVSIPLSIVALNGQKNGSSASKSAAYKKAEQYAETNARAMKSKILTFIKETDAQLGLAVHFMKELAVAGGAGDATRKRILAEFRKRGLMQHAECLNGLEHLLLWMNVMCIKHVQDKTLSVRERDDLIGRAEKTVEKYRKTANKTMQAFSAAVDKL